MMRFELGLERPDPKRALLSALSIAGAYVGGGLIPLAPYMMLTGAQAVLAFTGTRRSAARSRRCSSAGSRPVRPSGSPGPFREARSQ
jgi:VIT family